MDWRSWKKTGTKGAEEAERRAEVNYFFSRFDTFDLFLSLSLFSLRSGRRILMCVYSYG
ncbi:hypothetical protein OAV88_03545 [bacterium]|nr:hypothetical protein [bacterium]